jgi:hypothetical protein
MPFTPAHPAVVLPFLKLNPRYVSGTALVFGSVAPDFEYFFKLSVDSIYSHTVAGLFWFDLPVVFLLSWVFHSVVKYNLVDNLPSFLRSRFLFLKDISFIASLKRYPVAFTVSALAGAGSHIFWDSFTHANGFFVKELPFYDGRYIPLDGVNYPFWYAMQHLSTFIGLLLICIYIAFMPAATVKPDSKNRKLYYWGLVAGTAVVITVLRFIIRQADYNLGNLVVTGISGICVGLVLGGFLKQDHN